MESSSLHIPRINFSGLDLANPGSDEWISVRSQVMQALEEYSCFELEYEGFTPELREVVFGKCLKEAFDVPLETKVLNNRDSDGPFPPDQRYQYNIPGMVGYESLLMISGRDDAKYGVDGFTNIMWGENGNPLFRDTMNRFMKVMKEIDETVRRMVFEAFGAEKHFQQHLETYEHTLRISRYGAPGPGAHSTDAMGTHTDMMTMVIVTQHEEEGLECLAKDGSWLTPSRNSMTVIIGDLFTAYSNGRLEALSHRVRMSGNKERYSALYSSNPEDGVVVQPLQEVVDDEHPAMFKPFKTEDYMGFRFSERGRKAKSPIRAFCGVGAEEEAGI